MVEADPSTGPKSGFFPKTIPILIVPPRRLIIFSQSMVFACGKTAAISAFDNSGLFPKINIYFIYSKFTGFISKNPDLNKTTPPSPRSGESGNDSVDQAQRKGVA